MFWIGLLIALLGGLLSVALSREALKQRYPAIKEYHLDVIFLVVLCLGLLFSAVDHYKSERTLQALQEKVAPRHVSAQQRKAMLPILSAVKGRSIAIACRMMDGESCDYAKELTNLLSEAGCQVPELVQTSLNDSPGHLAITVYGKADVSVANTLIKAFRAADMPARIVAIKENSVGMWYPDTVHIIVGRKAP